MKSNDQRYPEWWRRRSFYKSVNFYTLEGVGYARKWQKARQRPLPPEEIDKQKAFLKLVDAQKNTWPVDQVGARAIAAGSQYIWRDVIGRAVVGRLMEFQLPNEEIKLVPAIQTALDTITNVPGSMLVRMPEQWIGLQLGTIDYFLGWNSEANSPQWQIPPQSMMPLVNGDTTTAGSTEPFTGLMSDGNGQPIAVPV